eukprot:gene4965-5773_t
MEWWDEVAFGDAGRLKIVCTPANHHSRRTLNDRNKALWCSYCVIDTLTNQKYYYTGDTGYCHAFKEIGQHYGPFDLACLPIGAYSPRWFMKHHHCDPKEAVVMHQEIKSKRSIGMHWGTFVLTTEPLLEPMELLKEETIKAGLRPEEFNTMKIGETLVLN